MSIHVTKYSTVIKINEVEAHVPHGPTSNTYRRSKKLLTGGYTQNNATM